MTADRAEPRKIRWVLLAILLGGTLVRLVPFVAAPSLYLDEAMLALNVALREPLGLTRPLDFEQSAPILFLWIEWVFVHVGGVTEHTLRLLPFLSGLALGPLTWAFARRMLPPHAALLATAIACFSPLAVWYANVAKPYATDATVATLLLVLAMRAWEAPGRREAWVALSAAAALAPFLSAPSVFLLGGIWAGFAARRETRVSPAFRSRVLGVTAAIAVGFLVNYFGFQRGVTNDLYLQRFYDRAFPWPVDPTLPQRLSELISGMAQLFFYGRLVDIPAFLLAATIGLGIIGVLRVHSRGGGWPLVALFLAPFGAVALAAVLRKYPPVERLLLYLTPLIVVLTAGGVHWLVGRLPRSWQAPVSVLGTAALLIPALHNDVRNALQPHGEGAEVRPVIAEYLERRTPGEAVYVYGRGVPIWAFYTTDWSAPDKARLALLAEAARRIGPNSGNAPSRGRPVDHEGFDLIAPSGDHVELIGIASGIEMRYGRGERRIPDPGWADNEVVRMRETARPSIWVFFTHHSTPVEDELKRAIASGGGVITHDRREWAVRLWRVEFR